MRQMEAAELMTGQSNYTATFAKAILAATPEAQLVDPRKKKPGGEQAVSAEQIARLERELASLQAQVKSVEETRSEEHTSELQSLMRISYAVFCLKKKTQKEQATTANIHRNGVVHDEKHEYITEQQPST